MVLPASMRIKGHRSFDYLYRSGIRFNGFSIILRVAPEKKALLKAQNNSSKKSTIRCAVVISNKVSKKAIIRNRVRRLLHTHLKSRLYNQEINRKKWVLIILKPKTDLSKTTPLLEECDKLLKNAGLF